MMYHSCCYIHDEWGYTMADDDNTKSVDPDASTKDLGKPSSAALPKKIGHYSIKSIIASGGMGTVYLAQQESPRRVVALKVMKKGVASKSALRRFEYESQILARLKHPNIALVYEAGTHDDGEGGVPYFAMEYIANANTIIEYAKSKKLRTRELLALFAKVCDAVHHGHQKGIIHRDLKPGNILVDSMGEPKIIDFGVAKATDSDMTITTLQTDIGQLIGTLQYMSPEQCDADPHDLDIRSDVYALGVVLYELLCGQLPYDLTGAAIHQAARVIKEQIPERPSKLDRKLRGDVEIITLKALEKERNKRYDSAAALGTDIQRFLNGDAITARPPGLMDVVRSFARQHTKTAATFAGGIIVLFIVLLIVTLMWGTTEVALRRARHAINVAREANDARVKDRLQRSRLWQTVNKSLQFDAMLYGTEHPLTLTKQAEVGRIYLAVGHPIFAEMIFSSVTESYERLVGDEHSLFARSLIDLSLALSELGKKDESLAKLEQALTIWQSIADNSASNSIEGDVASAYTLYNIGLLQQEIGNLSSAEEAFLRANDLLVTLKSMDWSTAESTMRNEMMSREFPNAETFVLELARLVVAELIKGMRSRDLRGDTP